jgi:hypothetical protein
MMISSAAVIIVNFNTGMLLKQTVDAALTNNAVQEIV